MANSEYFLFQDSQRKGGWSGPPSKSRGGGVVWGTPPNNRALRPRREAHKEKNLAFFSLWLA
jgi:hypothetical protein